MGIKIKVHIVVERDRGRFCQEIEKFFENGWSISQDMKYENECWIAFMAKEFNTNQHQYGKDTNGTESNGNSVNGEYSGGNKDDE